MPKALILGYTNPLVSPNSALAHERAVKQTYLNYGMGTADIAMFFGSEDLLLEDDVVAIFNNDSEGNEPISGGVPYAVSEWLIDNPYDLVIFSYVTDAYYTRSMGVINLERGIPVFMPMPNDNTEMSTIQNEQKIVFVGKGISSNIGGTGTRIDCFDNQSTTSHAVPMVAGKVSLLLDSLTSEQAIIALKKSCSDYPSWDENNGYGKVPDVIPVPDNYTLDTNEPEGTTYIYEPPEPDEDPEPEPDPTPDDEDIPDEAEPITDPTQPETVRVGSEITITRNETTATVKVYRKLKEQDEWELVGETTEYTFTDEIDPAKNYIYAIRLSNSETESALSESVYVAGEPKVVYTQAYF